jgi:hypothetical protein
MRLGESSIVYGIDPWKEAIAGIRFIFIIFEVSEMMHCIVFTIIDNQVLGVKLLKFYMISMFDAIHVKLSQLSHHPHKNTLCSENVVILYKNKFRDIFIPIIIDNIELL